MAMGRLSAAMEGVTPVASSGAQPIWIYAWDTVAPKGLNEGFDICPSL